MALELRFHQRFAPNQFKQSHSLAYCCFSYCFWCVIRLSCVANIEVICSQSYRKTKLDKRDPAS